MAELTLGQRVMHEAWGWVQYFHHLGDEGSQTIATEARLRAIADRATAAENLAVASERYIATIDGQRAWATGTDSELTEALAAWRAITEGVQS